MTETMNSSFTDIMELNLGPQHPSTHGVLRIKLRLDGETIISAEPVIGYLHTGVEKECETRTYHQVFTLVDRLDYMSGPAEEQAFAGAVEKLMGIEVPECLADPVPFLRSCLPVGKTVERYPLDPVGGEDPAG